MQIFIAAPFFLFWTLFLRVHANENFTFWFTSGQLFIEGDVVELYCPRLALKDTADFIYFPGLWFESDRHWYVRSTKTLILAPNMKNPNDSDGLRCSDARFNCSALDCDEQIQRENCANMLSRVVSVESIDNSIEIPNEVRARKKHKPAIPLSSPLSFVKFTILAAWEFGDGIFHCSNGSLLSPAALALDQDADN